MKKLVSQLTVGDTVAPECVDMLNMDVRWTILDVAEINDDVFKVKYKVSGRDDEYEQYYAASQKFVVYATTITASSANTSFINNATISNIASHEWTIPDGFPVEGVDLNNDAPEKMSCEELDTLVTSLINLLAQRTVERKELKDRITELERALASAAATIAQDAQTKHDRRVKSAGANNDT